MLGCTLRRPTRHPPLQVYSPHDSTPHAFHRTIYVFASPRGDKLGEPGAVRALRCQLARQNGFYAFEAPGEGDAVPPPLTVRAIGT